MFLKPEQNILKLGLREGMKVADFGAGSGAYTIASSLCVGYTGYVYSIEVQKNLLKKLESEVKELKLKNINCIWGNIEKIGGTKIADHSMDAVIIANVLFQAEDKIGVVDEAKRILKKGGKVLFIDWVYSGSIGPSLNNIVNERVAMDMFLKRGFEFIEKIITNEHHYGIIFKY